MKKQFWLRILLPVLILIIWDLFTRFGTISPFILPDPFSTVKEFIDHVRNGEFLANTVISLKRSMGGFLVGSILGIGSGILIGWSKLWEHLTDLLINFIRSVPKTALAPLFIVWFGIGDASKLLLIAFSSYFFTVIPTMEGVKNVVQTRLHQAASGGD
jgi:sulfonate transport system permease protein